MRWLSIALALVLPHAAIAATPRGPLAAADALVEAVWADDADRVVAAGKDGRVVSSADGGATWTALAPPAHVDLHAVWSDGKGLIVVAGDGGTIAHFDGTAWTVVRLPDKLALRALASAGDLLVAVGGDRGTGVVAYSSDGGRRWFYSLVHDTELTAVAGTDREHVIAVGSDGAIVGTDHNVWVSIAAPYTVHDAAGGGTRTSNPLWLGDYVDVRFDHGTWIALAEGTTVESRDGRHWTRRDAPYGGVKIAFRRGADLVVVGATGVSIRRGEDWTEVETTRARAPTASVPTAEAELGKIWRTPKGALYSATFSGGITANPRAFEQGPCPNCVPFFDLPYAGAISRSSDGGATWTRLTRP